MQRQDGEMNCLCRKRRKREEMAALHREMADEIETDSDALELYGGSGSGRYKVYALPLQLASLGQGRKSGQ